MTHLALPAPRGSVLGDVIPGDRVRDVALVIAGAALTTLGAQVVDPHRRRRPCRSPGRRWPS